jgi:NTE family protein
MPEIDYRGERLKNYCVKCGIYYGTSKKGQDNPRCDKDGCRALLRTRGSGLALSGGGYRAALFHTGTLWRLNELGWLKKLGEVTSVSGGSITAALLGLRWKDLIFDAHNRADNFTDLIVKPIRQFCLKTIDIPSGLAGLIYPLYNAADRTTAYYKKGLFGDSTLQDLPSDNEGPRFTIYATSLQTGVSVRFSKSELAEYHLGHIPAPKIALAVAVAASAAFPPVLGPLILKSKLSDWREWENAKPLPLIPAAELNKIRSRMFLTDGGVYDNMGLERVWDRYTTVLVSDASAPFKYISGTLRFRLGQLFATLRLIDIINSEAIRVRRRWMMENCEQNLMQGAYWGINTRIQDYELEESGCLPPLLRDSPETADIAKVRTRLNCFKPAEQEKLINWGYALTDAAMRRYILDKTAPAGILPYS